MNKAEFMNTLQRLLQGLETEEREKFISYYEEMIEDYKEEGLTEEAIIKQIGNPHEIAEQILEEGQLSKSTPKTTASKLFILTLLILGFPLWGSLVLAGVLVILAGYLVVWCVPFTTGVSSIAFFFTAIISIIGFPFLIEETFSLGIVQLGFGILAIGVALLLGFLTIYLSKKIIFLSQKILSFSTTKLKWKGAMVG